MGREGRLRAQGLHVGLGSSMLGVGPLSSPGPGQLHGGSPHSTGAPWEAVHVNESWKSSGLPRLVSPRVPLLGLARAVALRSCSSAIG